MGSGIPQTLPAFPSRWRAWLLGGFVVLLAAALRFTHLDYPHKLVFDETYYVKDAYSLLTSGYEREWPKDANTSFESGSVDVLLDQPEYVVHPPLGKWMIAAGMALFGPDSSFGWRFSAALVGTLSVGLLFVLAHRLFRSIPLAFVAALLLAVDGAHLTESRTSLLDIFLGWWVLAAFWALAEDRLRRTAPPPAGRPARLPAIRPWRWLAGVFFGCALATKWSALYFIAVAGLIVVAWDLVDRRSASRSGPRWLPWLTRDVSLSFLALVPTSLAVYVASWSGWFATSGGYDRDWAQRNPSQTVPWLPEALQSLWAYHVSAYSFHTTLTSSHPYMANAFGWLLQIRPTSFFYESLEKGQAGCAADSCSTAITSLGNPLIWWGATLSLFLVAWQGLARRDWRAGWLLAGVAAGWLPWFLYLHRTTYTFYSVVFAPFMVLALAYALGVLMGRPEDTAARRRWGAAAAYGVVTVLVLVSAFFLPVWTGEVIPYDQWRWRMWLPSWI